MTVFLEDGGDERISVDSRFRLGRCDRMCTRKSVDAHLSVIRLQFNRSLRLKARKNGMTLNQRGKRIRQSDCDKRADGTWHRVVWRGGTRSERSK
jgi:hypothetical protein